MIEEKLEKVLHDNHYVDCRETPRGVVGLGRFIFTVAIIVGLNMTGYKYRYCYHTIADAFHALKDWKEKGYFGELEGYIVKK